MLAQCAELKEALGVEEPADVVSQEVGEVWNPPSAARADNPRASYPTALHSLTRVLTAGPSFQQQKTLKAIQAMPIPLLLSSLPDSFTKDTTRAIVQLSGKGVWNPLEAVGITQWCGKSFHLMALI